MRSKLAADALRFQHLVAREATKRIDGPPIESQDAFFSEIPHVKSTVQDLANRAVRTGITVPGCQVVEEREAV